MQIPIGDSMQVLPYELWIIQALTVLLLVLIFGGLGINLLVVNAFSKKLSRLRSQQTVIASSFIVHHPYVSIILKWASMLTSLILLGIINFLYPEIVDLSIVLACCWVVLIGIVLFDARKLKREFSTIADS